MGLSGDSDLGIEQRYEDLCQDLNMDRNAADEAWHSYERIRQNYTLEGDLLHWLACALYVACRNSNVPTVGRPSALIEGNCVSLTRLLRSCKLSLIQFFNKMKKWQDMANLPVDFRNRIERLERNFAVSHVIFKKFKPIFQDIFRDPIEEGHSRPMRGRKHRRTPCTSAEVFSFCWTLFVYVKGNFPAISDDLVNSYHLLLSCMDLIFTNAVLADRRDLLNADFPGLPENFSSRDYKPSGELPCIIQLLCEKHDGIVVEAKGIKEHWWKPYISRLFPKRILKGRVELLSGLLDTGNFEINSKTVNKEYEVYVLNIGDFDERIFLGQDANVEIGTPARTSTFSAGEFARHIQVKRMQEHISETRCLERSTPLTGHKYLKEKDMNNVTPVSTATQSVSKLQALLSGRKTSPSEILLGFFGECSRNPKDTIISRVKEMGELFCTSYAQPSEEHQGSLTDFAKKRLQLGESLYYKTLENIMQMEKRRLPATFDFTTVLEQDTFHRSLFACCLEVVIFSYNSQRTFPWIIEVFNLEPITFYKVIELLIRAEDGLSRDVVKHLNYIEEQILESMAWRSESPLWDAIKETGLSVPSCEDVSLPSQLENSFSTSMPPSQLLSSPIPHPTVRRLAGLDRSSLRNIDQSPVSTSESENFPSPSTGSPVTTAKRRLFASTVSGATTTVNPVSVVTNGFTLDGNKTLNDCTSLKTVMTVQSVSYDSGTVYIPISPVTIPAAPSPAIITGTTTVQKPNSEAKNTGTTVSVAIKPKRTGSIGLFFRKFYHLANVRLQDLCDRLAITDVDLRRKIWTCFEYSVIQHLDLMMDRHLDQLIMCAVYVMAKVTGKNESFQEIMKSYRLQPQANSHVYRSVLLSVKKRRNSGSSEGSKGASGSNSPVLLEKEEEKEKDEKRKEQLSIRSSSTLPVPLPSSQPPTPTRMAGTGSSFESEDRGDLIIFYNKVYIQKVQGFVLKFSRNRGVESPPLSPLPILKAHPMSPRRRVSTNHPVYISPLKAPNVTLSPNRPLSYSFNRSPAKDLRAINNMLRMGERKIGKRIILQDDSESESPSKRLCPDLTLSRKIQNVITERQGATPRE